MFLIPEEWKSKRQRILEVYFEVRSVPKTAHRLGYKSPSFVRLVIHKYRDFIRTQDSGKRPEPVTRAVGEAVKQ